MNISYEWLQELSGTTLEPRLLAERLTMIGFAVEGVEAVGNDNVLDIDLTSNRPDMLSHLGVAREVAVMDGANVRVPEANPRTSNVKAEDVTAVDIEDPELCPRYAARVIHGVKIGPSPAWLVHRLAAIGQRPVNNVADITNYVMHELGQPLHAFDLARLAENRIVVRRARKGEKLTTLDGVARELNEQMLVIADAERAVAMAGVMGGEDSEISDSTVDVLIESAYFDPTSVRSTARALGLHTEASHRFERGTDYANVVRAQDRCVALICEIAGGSATATTIDAYPKKQSRAQVSIRPQRVKALTGLSVEAADVERILSALGFNRRNGEGEALSFDVPSWRVDVEREEDLVEEVARHTGYDKMVSALPASSMAGEYQPGETRRRRMRRAINACGFHEAISLSFIEAGDSDRIELISNLISAAASDEQFVTLSNSIIEGASRMRPTLLPGLLAAARHNLNHGNRDVKLFETGRIFAASAEKGALPVEREALALLATGGATEENRAGPVRELDFRDLKGALEAAIDAINIPALTFEAAAIGHLRKGQSAKISLGDGRVVGSIGRLSDPVAVEYKFRQPVFVAEIDFDALMNEPERTVLYEPLSRYPSVTRDVTVMIERSTTFDEMKRSIVDLRLDHLSVVNWVRSYEQSNEAGSISITLRIEYRSDERTLRDEEVDEMQAKVDAALARFGPR